MPYIHPMKKLLLSLLIIPCFASAQQVSRCYEYVRPKSNGTSTRELLWLKSDETFLMSYDKGRSRSEYIVGRYRYEARGIYIRSEGVETFLEVIVNGSGDSQLTFPNDKERRFTLINEKTCMIPFPKP